ncbi:Palmitoyltransferase ZDHHC3-like protein [Aix galericulata]|nr:Palmitoyltransferase ZDHHC3-like protein [Aix galericulata]
MAAAAAARCGRDPCGALCPLLAYLSVGYADYAVLAHVLHGPALRGRWHRGEPGGQRGGPGGNWEGTRRHRGASGGTGRHRWETRRELGDTGKHREAPGVNWEGTGAHWRGTGGHRGASGGNRRSRKGIGGNREVPGGHRARCHLPVPVPWAVGTPPRVLGPWGWGPRQVPGVSPGCWVPSSLGGVLGLWGPPGVLGPWGLGSMGSPQRLRGPRGDPLVPPRSPWCPFHAVTFNLIVLLLLACHTRAVFADPGTVPLPGTAIDFSDLRSAAPRKTEQSPEEWTVCSRCEAYRPPRAHHCRVCHRCVRRMDHHCPWINNCVGELNQKYFIQFLFYAGLASAYAAGLVLVAWLGPAGGDGAENRVQTAHCIVLLLESLLFGAFVTVVFYDQVVSIITDEPAPEQLRGRGLKEAKRPRGCRAKLAPLQGVFGSGCVLAWLFPCSCGTPAGPAYAPLPSCDV